MKKTRKPMSYVFTVISISAVILLMFYMNQSKQSDKLKETSLEKLTEVQKVLAMNLDSEYPESPRDVAKLHGDMTRLLYSGIEDDEVKKLAIKIRELYDDEFLENNPEDKYLKDLYSDIALWLQVNRKIEFNTVVNKELEETSVLDGKEYATAYISFTITEKGKTSELRRYLMRKDNEGRWKILGWSYLSGEED